eukprot:6203724-Pleurochrysis_carterae.AAC.1
MHARAVAGLMGVRARSEAPSPVALFSFAKACAFVRAADVGRVVGVAARALSSVILSTRAALACREVRRGLGCALRRCCTRTRLRVCFPSVHVR